jgi:hypothetical protein
VRNPILTIEPMIPDSIAHAFKGALYFANIATDRRLIQE